MLGIGFDTPSLKDLDKYTTIFIKLDPDYYKNYILKDVEDNNKDFIKLIVTDSGEILGILNKFNNLYMVLPEKKDYLPKIIKVIDFRSKIKK